MGQKSVECFEELEAWQAARQIVNSVYMLCRVEGLQRDFSLRDQLQRAAVSIMTNIAEGFERTHPREKLQFYNVARASCGEVRSLLYVAEDNYEHVRDVAAKLRAEVVRAGQLVSGLIRSTTRRLES